MARCYINRHMLNKGLNLYIYIYIYIYIYKYLILPKPFERGFDITIYINKSKYLFLENVLCAKAHLNSLLLNS